ncbi:MAG: hypothetical protein AAGK22_25870 [Acidobacteriota bacterium]
MTERDSSLNTLVKLHLGYAAVVTLLFVLWLAYLVWVLPQILGQPGSGRESSAAAFLPVVFGVLLIALLFAGHLVLLLLMSRLIRLRQRYRVCIAGNVLLCLSFPLGTMLGLYSLSVLPEAKTLFPEDAPL